MMPPPVIDGLQYCNWSEEIFRQMREGGIDAVHVTIAYHGSFREMVLAIEAWNRRFQSHPDLVFHGRTGDDVRRAQREGRTAVFFGLQTASPIEDDIWLVEICHTLGVRFMQLTYNNQSLLASGCHEDGNGGLTRFGRQVVAEMNRVGLVIDMSHSGERSTLEAIDASSRPVAVTHANPSWWHDCPRNKSDAVIGGLAKSGGMFGFSIYPHHLKGGTGCTLDGFCRMVAETAQRHGCGHLGIGSDLCQNQPDSVVEWMRNGRWSRETGFGGESSAASGFPKQPDWFRDNRDFPRLIEGLNGVGFSSTEVAGIMGGNWMRFYDSAFGPAD